MKKFFDYLNRRRLETSKPFLKGDILDIGCGSATIYRDLKPAGYVGIERDEEIVKRLKHKYPLADFYSRDVLKDNLNLNRKFDTAVLLAVIEHIKNPDLLYKEIKSHLKENGKLVMTTPTPIGNFVHTLLSYIGLTSKHAVKEHVNLYTLKKFIEIAKKYNFKIIKYRRFEFGCNSLIVFEQN